MTTYHVWLTGQDQPELVHADGLCAFEGELFFWDRHPERAYGVVSRRVKDWRAWSIVHDEADHGI